jgi:hypothetical protein
VYLRGDRREGEQPVWQEPEDGRRGRRVNAMRRSLGDMHAYGLFIAPGVTRDYKVRIDDGDWLRIAIPTICSQVERGHWKSSCSPGAVSWTPMNWFLLMRPRRDR